MSKRSGEYAKKSSSSSSKKSRPAAKSSKKKHSSHAKQSSNAKTSNITKHTKHTKQPNYASEDDLLNNDEIDFVSSASTTKVKKNSSKKTKHVDFSEDNYEDNNDHNNEDEDKDNNDNDNDNDDQDETEQTQVQTKKPSNKAPSVDNKKSIERLKRKISSWMDYDDKIKVLSSKSKKYKDAKKQQEQIILKTIANLEGDAEGVKIDVTDVNNNIRGRVYRYKHQTKKPLNENIVKDALKEYFMGNEKKVEYLFQKIDKKRPTQERFYLKRTKGNK